MDNEDQRLFIALAIAGDLSPELIQLYKKLRTTADQSKTMVKWSSLEQLHITLLFLGATPTDKIQIIKELLRKVADEHSPFDLNVGGVGAFPDELEARVIWIGVQNKIALRELRSHVVAELRPVFKIVNDHEFTPHITMGRVRSKQSVRKILEPFRRKQVGEIRIAGLSLFESIQAGSFAQYKELERFEFQKR